MQEGETHLSNEDYDKAESAFKSALRGADRDYTAHVLMARCMLIREKSKQAISHAAIAKQLYPGEYQGHYISGLAGLSGERFTRAYGDFKTCETLLGGNPQVTFYMGYCLDKTNKKDPAAQSYMSYLKKINYASNKYSQYAYKRLKAWGYAK